MSVNDFRKLGGNLERGGIVRGAGEKEPAVPRASKSAKEIKLEKNELLSLRKLLEETEFFDKKWNAGQVLALPKLIEAVRQKLHPEFRKGRLEEHLRAIATLKK